jgi:DNA-binding transcriptional regulator YbjK
VLAKTKPLVRWGAKSKFAQKFLARGGYWLVYQPMKDKRTRIVEAGLAVIREQGFNAFTQIQVAARVGLRQSHLTYYFPTRNDLLAGVGRAAIESQLAMLDGLLKLRTAEEVAAVIGRQAARHENTRVMMALAQAAEEEPRLRELFRELADGIFERLGKLLTSLGAVPSDEHRRLLHALSVGLAVVDLAVARPGGERRAAEVFSTVLNLISVRPRKAQASRQGKKGLSKSL